MKRAYGILGLLVIAVLGVAIATRVLAHGDDKTMIQTTLRQSLEASHKGEPGGVLEALSSRLKVNDENATGYSAKIASYIRNQKPDIEVLNQTPIITGDEARIISPVKIKVSLPIIGDQAMTVNDVTLVFHRESAREFLIFPVSKWRLAEVRMPEVPQLLGVD